jgi:hypothetical protein
LSGLKAKLVPDALDDEDTNSPTSAISFDESLLRKEGIPFPPLRTWRSTTEASGFSSSRFGPICPFAPAALSV